MHLRRNQPGARRRGVILLVVLAMLTLFAIIGITFVLYSNATGESARINRDTESLAGAAGFQADVDPQAALSLFLGDLIYGADNQNGLYNGVRGHSLAETMYGSFDANQYNLYGTNGPFTASDKPYDGQGRLHYGSQFGVDDFQLVNYTYYSGDGFLRDPSTVASRPNAAAAPAAYAGGQNAPYTYPDLNSMFLASIRASDGLVTMPSFHRPWLFNPTNAFNDPTNPNWTNAQGKYLTLRPRPADNPTIGLQPGFPYPTDATGDVKNLVGMPGGNDSVWIDIDAPEYVTPAGQKYKMLVAPLILPLDNRVNLNVVGNVLGNFPAGNVFHAGNQGLGAWEANMSKVLNQGGPEWQNIFLGNAGANLTGRYGAGKLPSWQFTPFGAVPHVYGQIDLQGLIDPVPAMGQPAQGPTGLYSIPGGAGTVPYQSFPLFPANGYGNGAPLETTTTGTAAGTPNHPMFYNPMVAPADGSNRLLPLASHASLLYANGSATASELRRLCPLNFPAGAAGTRILNETTLWSFDLDRPGASAWIFDRGAAANILQFAAPASLYPVGAAVPWPALASRGAPTPAASEFQAPGLPNTDPAVTWKSNLPANFLTRLDLDRTLTPYPPADPATHQFNLGNAAILQQYNQATADRQQFAQDLFNRLVAVTNLPPLPATPTAAQYDPYRWLAQLAANIVDYIDTDDVNTPFHWDPADLLGAGSGWVFGTEVPKLVINETFVQYNNHPGDPFPMGKATTSYDLNVWVELLNPMPGPDANGSNQAELQNPAGTAVYQVQLTRPNVNLRARSNILGDPDPGTPLTATPVNSFGAGIQQVVLPVGGAYSGPSASNQGFYVLGPADGTLPATLRSPNMTWNTVVTAANANTPPQPSVLLRRLSNPYLPPQPAPAAANFNPYLTVDYVENVPWNDARTNTTAGANGGLLTPQTRFSYGRTQPYAGAPSQLKQQQPNPPNAASPQQTFYRHNAREAAAPLTPWNAVTNPNQTLKVPFDWLVHLDRPLVSPAEILHVSGFKPHELTQQFVQPDANPAAVPFGDAFNHVAPWTDPAARIYRLMEFVKVKNPTPGIVHGGRIPGKVNINTLDPTALEVFLALADAEPGNTFNGPVGNTDQYATQVFTALMARRTPGGTPGGNDRPFLGLAAGVMPGGAGGDVQTTPQNGVGAPVGRNIDDTLLGALVPGNPPGSQRVLEPNIAGVTHPYQRSEMLNKLFNNLTTRSNCFAVFVTVGFFAINDDTVRPYKLGIELNPNVRHHMFAIVDRTQLQTFSTTSTTAVTVPAGSSSAVGSVTPAANPVSDARTNRTWNIQPGSVLVYEPNTPNEETVLVGGVPGALTATFTLSHNAGVPVASRGHPGPWVQYDPRQDNLVVPYFVIID